MQLSVCFTGHRPEKLIKPYSEQAPLMKGVKALLEQEIRAALAAGARDFYSGMARGTDILASELVISCKTQYPDLRHIAVIPCREQCDRWETEWISRYESILAQSDQVLYLSEGYSPDCFRLRNRFLVDHSDRVIAVYNGDVRSGTGQTIAYARKQAKQLWIIRTDGGTPRLLQENPDEGQENFQLCFKL